MKSTLLLISSCLLALPNDSRGRVYNIIQHETVRRKTTIVPEVIDKTCLLKPDKGPCRGNIEMYYFDPNGQNCNIFYWGGCQGNGNRFDTYEECKSSCLTTFATKRTQRYCRLTFDYGWCFGAEERWYYDPRWKVCKKVIYSGCGGNKNNFYNKEQCDQICRFGNPPLVRGGEKGIKEGMKKVLIMNPDARLPLPHPSTTEARLNGNDPGKKQIVVPS